MSGIAGLFFLDGQPVDIAEIQSMMGELQHRGLNGEGVWSQGFIGLGHRMLWNTPESRFEQMPLISNRGNAVITADVRLDHRTDLCGMLGIPAQECRDFGDCQLILAAYEKWGTDCPTRIHGDFAFAIWDEDEQFLFCARDCFGIKPFCYYHSSDRFFAFASQVKALVSLGQIPRLVNEERIADYVSGFPGLEGIDKTSTFVKGIYRLPPAHALVVGREIFSVRRYWSLDPVKEIHFKSREQTVQAFFEVFTSAIYSNLRCASTPGFMMSGGIDSTSIVGVARTAAPEHINLPVLSFSGITSGGEDRETRNIQLILNTENVHGTTISPDKLLIFDKFYDDLFTKSDDLFDSNVFNFLMPLYVSAYENNIHIMLDGMPADNVVSKGKEYLNYLLRDWKLAEWISEILSFGRSASSNYPIWNALYQSMRSVMVPDWGRKLWRSSYYYKKPSLKLEQKSIINPAFAEAIDLFGRYEKWKNVIHQEQPATIRESHANNLNAPYIAAAVERYDRVASLYSIEARHPFLNRRLVEFCLSLPWSMSTYRGRTKVILRDAMSGLLPEKVLQSGYCPNPSSLFLKEMFKIKREYIASIINNHLNIVSGYIDIPVVKQSYKRCLENWNPKDAGSVLIAINLASWIQRID